MVRSQKGIEILVNLINISYCAMKILSYQDVSLNKYQSESVQGFHFALSEQIRRQIVYAILAEIIETCIKSKTLINALKQVVQQHGYYL